jgi:hypothetical protein
VNFAVAGWAIAEPSNMPPDVTRQARLPVRCNN